MKDNNKVRRLQAGKPRRSRARARSKTSNSKLLSDYETMLRLYLISKEQLVIKRELKYNKLTSVEKATNAKESFSMWNGFLQIVRKSNQLLNTLTRPGIAILGE